MHLLALDPAATCAHLERFLKESVGCTGLQRVVLGLSGGIDSALAAALAVRALGAQNVHAIALPFRAVAGSASGIEPSTFEASCSPVLLDRRRRQ